MNLCFFIPGVRSSAGIAVSKMNTFILRSFSQAANGCWYPFTVTISGYADILL